MRFISRYSALFVEPRYAHLLSSSAVTAALGKREAGKDVKIPVPQEATI